LLSTPHATCQWPISQASISQATRCRPTGPACHTSCCHCCTGCYPSLPYAAAWCCMMQLLATARLPLWQAASAQLLLLSHFLSSLTACSIATQEMSQLAFVVRAAMLVSLQSGLHSARPVSCECTCTDVPQPQLLPTTVYVATDVLSQ